MTTFLNYWWVFAIAALAICGLVVAVIKFIQAPTSEQLTQIKSWLLYAVTEAEKKFGSKTGQIKLAYVYDLFAGKFPSIAKFLSYNTFSEMVDNVLTTFRSMLESNTNLQEYVEGETVTEEV